MLALGNLNGQQYGFYGIHGLLGVVLSFVLMFIVIWGLWTVFGIVKQKFSNEATGWMFEILRVVLIVIIAIWFITRTFNLVF